MKIDMEPGRAVVVVEIAVEVEVGPWGSDAPIAQVVMQSKREAAEKLRGLLNRRGIRVIQATGARVVCPAKVRP